MKTKKDGLFRAGIIFFIGSFTVAIFNYLYHLFMGRMLGPVEYGVLGSLFAIIYISTFATSTFNKVISKFASEFKSNDQTGFLNYLLKRGFYKITLYGIIALIIYLLFIPLLQNFLNLDSNTGLILTGIVAFLSLIFTLFIGILNGLQKFILQNISSIISVIFKFSLAVILVFLGFGVNGALVAIAIGVFIGIIFAAYSVKDILFSKIKQKFNTKKVYMYAIPVFIGSVVPILLITLDILLVKHYFSSYDTGLYSALGFIGKIIWFGSGFIVPALFPKIVKLKSENKDTSKMLVKGIIITLSLAIIGLIIYFMIPTLIVNLLFGPKFIEIVPLIGYFGIGMALFSISQIIITYNLAIEKYHFIPIIIFGLIIEITGIILYHQTLTDIVKIFTVTNALILIGLIITNLNIIFKSEE
ncbi:oligosaccharide flippase family protein [Candidatus Pacearchaeota archaeon]|nr:oligosaccharide flippase family protein [Candidatus Pacearchaeota archaeon]